ncbi:MAG: putative molecular chaperone [Ignavibacteria bacterium]|nr:MAG: putative molecular chaperone [Ignavibacteria bacterium]KAF0158348.1 MAG: putative molecular chaperone [Ignavibacteria bacterium]
MNKLFPILAIETAGEMCSAAVLLDEKIFVELNHLQKHIHSQKLIEMIDIVLAQSSVKLKEIKAVAVSMGPGSFTGLRIGAAAAKGLAFGSSLPIIPVKTLDALALQIFESISQDVTFNIISSASIDEVYFAKYQIIEKKLEVKTQTKLVERTALENLTLSNELNFGNVILSNTEITNVHLRAGTVGKWAYLFGSDLLTFDYDNLEPNYLKQFVGKRRL